MRQKVTQHDDDTTHIYTSGPIIITAGWKVRRTDIVTAGRKR